MTTNRPALRTVEEFMSDYTPTYKAIFPLFLAKAQQHAGEVGKNTFKRIDAVGDIRQKHYTPKDTEMHQIAVTEGSKTYKRYFLANQFVISHLQAADGREEVVARVLDEHQKQADDLILLGEGSSNSTMINNGIYWSNDPNYTLENSAQIAASGRLLDFHAKVMTTATKAKTAAGRKVIIFYGTSVLPLYNSLHVAAPIPVKSSLEQVLGPDFSTLELPAACTPTSANGWMVCNMDQIKTHYTILPKLFSQGVNSENMYDWFNFAMGSFMVECLAENAIVRQPATLE